MERYEVSRSLHDGAPVLDVTWLKANFLWY